MQTPNIEIIDLDIVKVARWLCDVYPISEQSAIKLIKSLTPKEVTLLIEFYRVTS